MAELTSKFKIGAYWFPGWKNSAPGNSGPLPWASNDTTNNIYVGDTATFPERQPALGYYDESSQTVIDALILDMVGPDTANPTIDFVAFDWYCDPTVNTLYLNHAIDKFRTSPNKNLMQFCVAWINDSNTEGYTLAQFDWAIGQIINYFADSAYLTKDNKPVLIMYNVTVMVAIAGLVYNTFAGSLFRGSWKQSKTYALNDYILASDNKVYKCIVAHSTNGSSVFATDLAAAKWSLQISGLSNTVYGTGCKFLTDRMRAAVVTAGYTQGAYLVACTSAGPFDSGDFGAAPLGGFDALTTYNYQNGQTNFVANTSGGSSTNVVDRAQIATSGGSPNYYEMDWTYRNNWHNMINYTSTCKYWVPLLCGWNKAPWLAPSARYPTTNTASAKHHCGCSPLFQDFREHLIAARKVMENTARTDGFGIFYAATEWGEGGFLPSTMLDGRAKLNIIDQVFNPTDVPLGLRGEVSPTKSVIYLDGTSGGLLSIPDNAALQFSNGAYTLMIRWRSVSPTINAYLAGRSTSQSNTGYGMFLSTNADGLTLDPGVCPNSLLQTQSRTERTLNVNQATRWHHQAVSFDGTPASGSRISKIYVDGALVSTRTNLTNALPVVSGFNFTIGNNLSGNTVTAFNGWICDVYLYNRVLTDAEVLAAKQGLPVSTSNLLIALPMDDGTGTVAVNIAGSGIGNATLGGGCKWITNAQAPNVMPIKN